MQDSGQLRAPLTQSAGARAHLVASARGTRLAALSGMRPTKTASAPDPENHKDQRKLSDEDPGIETDPLPHHAHEEVPLGDDEIEEARLASDDLVALDEDDLVYAEGPDA